MLCHRYTNLCHLVDSRQSQLPAQFDSSEHALHALSLCDADTQSLASN